MKRKKQTETPPKTQYRESTVEDFAGGFDLYAKQIAEKANNYAEPKHRNDPELAKWYLTYKQVVANWRRFTIRDLKDRPALPYVPPLIGDDYLGGMIHLADCCKSCEAILTGKDKQGEADVPALDEDELKVLNHLNERYPQIETEQDTATATNITAKTVRKYLAAFKQQGLVCLPEGKKRGCRITERGRDYITRYFS